MTHEELIAVIMTFTRLLHPEPRFQGHRSFCRH